MRQVLQHLVQQVLLLQLVRQVLLLHLQRQVPLLPSALAPGTTPPAIRTSTPGGWPAVAGWPPQRRAPALPAALLALCAPA